MQLFIAGIAAANLLTTLPAFGAGETADGSWRPAAPMAQPREHFTATALKNGKVLVAGGLSPGADPAGSAALYDPVANSWSPTARMITSRSLHAATLLQDGRVLVVGGAEVPAQPAPAFLNTAEIYDPTKGAWSAAGAFGPVGRHWHTATLLKDGKVLVVGGRNQSHELSYADAWLFDPAKPAAGAWTQTGSFEVARRSHTATLMGDGTVLITGGQVSGHDASLNDALIYDPPNGVFKPARHLMAVGRAVHTATLVPGGRVLLAGGTTHPVGGDLTRIQNSTEIYDPKTQTFKPAGAMVTPTSGHAAVALPGGGLLVAGGMGRGTPDNTADAPIYSAETYNPKIDKWSPAGALTPLATKDGDPLSYEAAVLLDQKPCGQNCGKILALGASTAMLHAQPSVSGQEVASTATRNEAKSKSGVNKSTTWVIAGGIGLIAVVAALVIAKRRRR